MYKITNGQFITKQSLIRKCIEIRDSYKNRENLSTEDKNWLLEEVFKYHPNWNNKVQKPIKNIIVNNNWQQYNSRCFFLIYDDNTYDDISFRWSIQNRPKETMQSFNPTQKYKVK